MIKFVKRAVSALLASIMCIPTGILTIANATEMESNGEYTVTLTESEGGFMQFSDNCLIESTASQDGYQMVTIDEDGNLQEMENDGTVYAFKKGDNIEIELIPDDGYEVQSFEIRDVNTERVMAFKETSDNFFQFVMPEKNIVVKATFSDGSVSTIPIVDEKDPDEQIEYQDITETGEISKAEVEEVIVDIITENYIKSHLNEDYVTVGDNIQLANVLLVKNTMFDGQYVEDDDTINSIMYSIQEGDENIDINLKKLLGQVEAYTMVYDLNEESDYFVTYANTMMKDSAYTVQDYEFAIADMSGTTIDGCIYDEETGLVYIPKELYNDGTTENAFMYLQVQFMQVLNKRSRSADMESSVHALSVDEDNETIELQSSTQRILAFETVVNVATGMNPYNLNVIVNGVYVPSGVYTYDSETGELTIAMSPASVVSVEVSEGEETLSDKLIEFMTDEVIAVTTEEMKTSIVGTVSDISEIPGPGWGTTITLPITYAPNKANVNNVYTTIVDPNKLSEQEEMAQNIFSNSIVTDMPNGRVKYYDIIPDFRSYTGQYQELVQQLGTVALVCSHIESPLGTYPVGVTNFNGDVHISVADVNVTEDPLDGTISGYLVLGIVTVRTHRQTGIGYIKISFGDVPPPPPVEIERRDPVNLVLYKISSIPMAELESSTLAGAKYTVVFFPDVEYTSPQECINNSDKANNVWIFQTKQDDSWVPYFSDMGVAHTGFINFADASYLAPESPTDEVDSFGYSGTYWFYETAASDGYLLEGVMQDYATGNGTNDVSNLGLVYYIDMTGDTPIVKCNGQVLPPQIGGVIQAGAIPTDAIIVAEKPDIPSIETQSSVEDTGTQYGDATSNSVVCVDDVNLYNLREQTLYTLETYLIDVATGARVSDIVTTYINSATLSSNNWNTRIKITLNPSASGLNLANHTLMFVNKLYDPEQADPIAVSDDLSLINEYIYFPNSGTLALDRETGKHITYSGHKLTNTEDPIDVAQSSVRATITDKIWYENLQGNRQYEIKAWMVDCDTGSAADDGNGSPIVISEETRYFTSDASGSGTVNVTFSFDINQSIAGRKYVIYSEIYLNNELVSSHRMLNDEDEMIWIPKITTKLTDSKTGTDITYADGVVQINDQVDYSRLKPGDTYMVKGTLYNMNTQEVLLDDNGDEVTVTQTFTPTSENGTLELNYVFPADTLAGTVSVSYVELYVQSAATQNRGQWVLVAEHKDFYDKNQRNYMPYITTTALDQKTAHHISYAEKTMKLYDIVHYEALVPETTYKLVSELRDATTGEIVVDNAGVQQIITSYFKADYDLLDDQYLTYGDIIPENHDGSGITFEVDAEYFAGRTLVVYERLYLENEYGSNLIAEHQDILDEDQTIYVPKIWTSAIDSDTFTKTSFADNSSTIIDTVSYDNLIPGLTYELKGYIIDKNQSIQTGTSVVATGTNGKLAENTMTFTPESSNGAVKLSFEVDTSKFGTDAYNGMTFVVYEELYVIDRYDDADHRCLVATHTDIADVNQTVYVPRITTSLNDSVSGSKIMLADKDAHLVDTVNYYKFQPSSEYTIKGKLIDMETGDVLIDSKGNRIEKTVDVTSSSTGTGSWKVDYEFDATELQGKVIVAYADVYVKNGEREDILSHVASHNDMLTS